jgi:hypothetical protein
MLLTLPVLRGTLPIILRGKMVKLYESKAWLYKRYIVEKKNIVQMAQEANCSHMTIQRALDKMGIRKSK